jgi:hypothetical protein
MHYMRWYNYGDPQNILNVGQEFNLTINKQFSILGVINEKLQNNILCRYCWFNRYWQ